MDAPLDVPCWLAAPDHADHAPWQRLRLATRRDPAPAALMPGRGWDDVVSGPSPTPAAASGSPPSTPPPSAPDPLAPAASTRAPSLPVTLAEYRGVAALSACFVATMALALWFAGPFKAAGLQVFSDPDSVTNPLWYIALIIGFTFGILALAKYGKKWMIRAIILLAFASTIAYVIFPLLLQYGVSDTLALVAAGGGAALALAALYLHPEWYVVDGFGLLVAAASAALFGISLGIVPVFVLLVLLAIYDAIAVYRTKHMLSLADSVIELQLPVLLVIPKHAGYRFQDERRKLGKTTQTSKEEREAMFMGLGDLVMPSILVVSAFVFPQAGWGMLPVLGAIIGTLVGYAVLMGFVLKGNPQAGLPLLNGGAITGFLAGVVAATGSLRFW